MQTYTASPQSLVADGEAPKRALGYTYDDQGRLLSLRRTDGTGWDCTYDKQGREVSCRHTDGTGWDKTYDKRGPELSLRRTDGTGWDCTYDKQGREVSRRRTDGTGWDVLAWHNDDSLQANLDGTYTAGCRENLTRQQALAHWARDDDRALLFTFAIMFCAQFASCATI
jgi:YD repeat-containing protein